MQHKILKIIIKKWEEQKGTKASIETKTILNRIATMIADELDDSLNEEIEQLIALGR